jgi:hypothetical protein
MIRRDDVLELARELEGLDTLSVRLVCRELHVTQEAALSQLKRLWGRGLIEPISKKPRPARYKTRPWWREPWHGYGFRLTDAGRRRLDFLGAKVRHRVAFFQ